MHRFGLSVLLFTFSIAAASAQEALTREQRISDLTQLASQYAKNYGPYEWKRDVQGFDLMRLTPWLKRIQHSDDLDFQEALIEYVASLNDAHDTIAFPTTFSASLPMTVDIYDGKVLIDSINRSRLPVAQFPFVIGDELVSLDGQSVQSLIQSFRKYAIAANERSTDRIAAARLVSRSQQIMPHIVQLGDAATVVIRLAATGATSTYTIPWVKIEDRVRKELGSSRTSRWRRFSKPSPSASRPPHRASASIRDKDTYTATLDIEAMKAIAVQTVA